MEKSGVGRLHWLHDERDGRLGDLARKGSNPERCLDFPGNDVRDSLHLRRKRMKKDPLVESLPAAVAELHAINGVDGRQNADTADDSPGTRLRFVLRFRIDGTAKAGINRIRDVVDVEIR